MSRPRLVDLSVWDDVAARVRDDRRAADRALAEVDGPTTHRDRRSVRNQAALNLNRILNQRDQWASEQPMRVSCAFCDWRAEGPAGQMRDLQHAHRLQHVTPKVSRRKPRGQWNINHAGLHDNIARARAEGAAQWTDGEMPLDRKDRDLGGYHRCA